MKVKKNKEKLQVEMVKEEVMSLLSEEVMSSQAFSFLSPIDVHCEPFVVWDGPMQPCRPLATRAHPPPCLRQPEMSPNTSKCTWGSYITDVSGDMKDEESLHRGFLRSQYRV